MDGAQAEFAYMRDQPGSLKSRKDWWEVIAVNGGKINVTVHDVGKSMWTKFI